MTTEIKNINMALLEFQKDPPVILCDGENTFYKDPKNPKKGHRYPKLDSVYNKVVPALNKLGVIIISYSERDFLNELTVEIIHVASDTSKKTRVPLLNISDMQKWGGSETYARRRGTLHLLGLVGDEDDDGNTAIKTDKPQTNTPPAAKDMDHGDMLYALTEMWKDKKSHAFAKNAKNAQGIQDALDNKTFLSNHTALEISYKWVKSL